ncbi:hypothetical protein OHA72_20865 [Dactylosporangium sp. NBC_01737]|uniref:hypothetical protein n=1 Tax=Dactylosporangium sp. NBC_01737 TaxID=2975959 RepID=UPI002E149186|nr:hypothetical protein OHA72_20865 [Dactylosporangium sp. NBC_01737]
MSRQETIAQQMAKSARIQAEAFEQRSTREVDWDFAINNRCECHMWELWRCHVVQADDTARHVERKRYGRGTVTE